MSTTTTLLRNRKLAIERKNVTAMGSGSGIERDSDEKQPEEVRPIIRSPSI